MVTVRSVSLHVVPPSRELGQVPRPHGAAAAPVLRADVRGSSGDQAVLVSMLPVVAVPG
jgi:hypothetical protein